MASSASQPTIVPSTLPTRGMVTSPHALASEAAAQILRDGGNAIEAIICASAVLSVVYPHFCGLGGDAVWMFSDGNGQVDCLSAIGQAASDLPLLNAIPTRGPMSMLTTACLVDSWGTALEHSANNWQGTFDLERLLQPAIKLAQDGFEVSASQKHWMEFRKAETTSWPRFLDTFVPKGQQRQTDLAFTLRQIAARGYRDFYEGELAERIAHGLEAAGSVLRLDDLNKTHTRKVSPSYIDYRGYRLYAPPPPTQGITTLGIMGVLENFAMDAMPPDSADFFHHCVEAVKQAFADRSHIEDPDFSDFDFNALLAKAHLKASAQAINPNQAQPWPKKFNEADTVYLAATDANGQSVSMLQSTYYDWGSGVIVGDTGIIWQNRGAAFGTDPSQPNLIQPSKRPFYTLNPGLATYQGKPHLLYGTQGADGQPQTLALLLSLLLDHQFTPDAALRHPRFLLGKTFSDARDSLKLEASLPLETQNELSRRGHEVSSIPALSPLAGQAGIIKIAPDGDLTGAHDPRSDGYAINIGTTL